MSAVPACSSVYPVKLAVKPEAKVHLAFELPIPVRGQSIVPACFPFTHRERFFSMNSAYGYVEQAGDISEVTCVRCRNKIMKSS
jgi:hypothetical protein